MDNEKMSKFIQMIEECNKIVFLGGAGVSTGSGIPDYRSKDGLYTKGTPEEMLSNSKLRKDPQGFYDFVTNNMIYPDATPNQTHIALMELEQLGKLTCIGTQNIDGLHQKAGSKNVYEVHGNLQKFHCVGCGQKHDLDWYILNGYTCPNCGSLIRPDVVLYDEQVKEEAFLYTLSAIKEADMLIIGGTSMQVYPFAMLPEYFNGKYRVLINKEPIEKNRLYRWLNEDINEVFTEVRKWIEVKKSES
jgi:NAD-dependent deacetylase